MIIVYHGARPYLPSLACSLHLGLSHEAEGFFQAGFTAASADNPFRVVGQDSKGNVVCYLVHGRHEGLYKRVLEGAAGIFDIPCRCINVEQLLTLKRCEFRMMLPLTVAKYLPEFIGTSHQRTIAKALRAQLKLHWEELP